MSEAPKPELLARLFAAGHEFDLFQAVRLLERLFPEFLPVGRSVDPDREVLRFRNHLALAFPPSAIFEVEPPNDSPDRELRLKLPRMTVASFGLYGANGALPLHYTSRMLDIHRDIRGPERRALRDWLDVFNHRLISLHYRAWEKYRFWRPYERGEGFSPDRPDPFTQTLFSLIGLGEPATRGRLTIRDRAAAPDAPPLAQIDDLGLLYYAGILRQRPANAQNLGQMLGDYFGLPVEVRPFCGQWLALEPSSQTCLGRTGVLGESAVAGSRVWDVQSKFRLRVGPLTLARFQELLPDRAPIRERKELFLLMKFARFAVGLELDFDVQLVLKAAEVPPCRIGESEGVGGRLGWNTWLTSVPRERDADDACFVGVDVRGV